MNEIPKKYNERTYNTFEVCHFRKTKDEYGGLSNMASGYPLHINDIKILTSEAIYQACRFPHLPEVQKKIIEQKSPISAKMVGKPYRDQTRPDWDYVRVDIMRWSLRVKLTQNFFTFGRLLETTNNKSIVEDSKKDKFWGAVRDKNNSEILNGVNALGRLLMELRQEYMSENRYKLLYVEPLNISDFLIFGQPIEPVDERQNFIDYLIRTFNLKKSEKKIYYNYTTMTLQTVQEPESTLAKPKDKKEKTKKKQKEDKQIGIQTTLPF